VSTFGKTITIEGADNAAFTTGVLSVSPFLLANHPTEEAPETKNYWGYKKLNHGRTHLVWNLEFEPFSLAASDQDEGDYIMLKIVLKKRFKRITACTLDRQDVWYDNLTGFSAGEITAFGITSPYPVLVSWTGMGDSLDKPNGQRKLSLVLTSVNPA